MSETLYKILSLDEWEESQGQEYVCLPAADKEFIHFSTEDQLERILKKYWADAKGYVVLKVDAKLLVGRLVYEANPGGVNKYWHLYDGKIPLNSILEIVS